MHFAFTTEKLPPFKWENAMTIDAKSWGFRADASLSDYLTIEDLIETLVSTVRYALTERLLVECAWSFCCLRACKKFSAFSCVVLWLDSRHHNSEAVLSNRVWFAFKTLWVNEAGNHLRFFISPRKDLEALYLTFAKHEIEFVMQVLTCTETH